MKTTRSRSEFSTHNEVELVFIGIEPINPMCKFGQIRAEALRRLDDLSLKCIEMEFDLGLHGVIGILDLPYGCRTTATHSIAPTLDFAEASSTTIVRGD